MLGLVKRFVDPAFYEGNARTNIILLYKVIDLFPDAVFWRSYQLGFMLKSIAWFLSADGRAKLTTDIALFHLDLSSKTEYDIKNEKTGDDVVVPRPKGTVADLFK